MIKTILQILVITSTLFFTACSFKDVEQDENKVIPKEKMEIITETAQEVNDNFFNQEENTKIFFKKFFIPWEQSKISLSKSDAMWYLKHKSKDVWLENYRKAPIGWHENIEKNANFISFGLVSKKAITIRNTNVRILPTNSPTFADPKKPGEGWPFDYNQNSLLKINTPIFISHFSKDKQWAYMESFIVSGWVEVKNIAFVDKDFISRFKNSDFYVSVKEKFPLKNLEGDFVEQIKLATIFPKFNGELFVAKKVGYYAKVDEVEFEEENLIEEMPLKFNSENRIKIAKEFMNEPYGWGGLMNNRDCSSFTQDYFLPFGKFLNRNSKAQIENGKYLVISHLSDEEKKKFIMKNGVPFSTLVYMKGHVMLYVGTKNNEPLVMHNIWSLRLKNKWGESYRFVIGKTTITTLEPGKALKDFDEDSNLIKKIQGIVIL